MHSRLRPSPAMVIALIALFVALGGSAAALSGSNTVQSDDLGPGSQVTAPDVAANAVNGSDVVDNSLLSADLGPNSVGTSEAVNNSLTGTDINESTLQGVNAATVDGAKVCDGVVELSISPGNLNVTQDVCTAGPLTIQARCLGLSGSIHTDGQLRIVNSADDSFYADSSQSDSDWDIADGQKAILQIGTALPAGTIQRMVFSAGATDGSQLAGEVAVQVRPEQVAETGTCRFSLGVIG